MVIQMFSMERLSRHVVRPGGAFNIKDYCRPLPSLNSHKQIAYAARRGS
jgi:hypothetical protein